MDAFQRCVTIGEDHPALPGHFPGQPVVPGVVILDEVVVTLKEGRMDEGLAGFQGVKCLCPLLPGEPMVIELIPGTSGQITFTCTSEGGDTIAQGRLRLRGGV